MNPIYWLICKRPYKHLSHHFILKIEDYFMVFSSKPLTGIKSTKLSEVNIEGQPFPQYIIEKVHHYDPASMIVTKAEKGIQFYITNQQKLDKLIQILINQ